jgi:DNA-binding CsgD family transcriptional regulator
MQRGTAKRVLPRLESRRDVPIDEASKSSPVARMTPPRSEAGFLLTDSLLNPISFNTEAVKILSYPDKLVDLPGLSALLTEKIGSTLLTRLSTGESSLVTEFRSGRRRYFCRAFHVHSGSEGPSQQSTALLLERGASGLFPLSQVSEQFHLTRREQEVLEYVVQGMTIKVIASRMNLSPNTVKAFLRMIMIKTGAASRSAIVGNIVMNQPR